MDEWDQFNDDPWSQFQDSAAPKTSKRKAMDPRLQTAIRSTVRGATSPLAFFADAVNAVPNLAAKAVNAVRPGTVGYLPMGKDYVDAGLRQLGIDPNPQSTAERAVTAATGAMTGAGLAGAGRALFGEGLPALADMAQQGGQQAIAAGSGVIGSQLGRQAANAYNVPEPLASMIEAAGGIAAGGIAPSVASAVKRTGGRIGDTLTTQGKERIAGRVLNRQAADPGGAMGRVGSPEINRQLVPGSAPTMAEVTQDPGLARLQRTLTSSPLAIDAGVDQVNAVRAAQMDEAIYEAINKANKIGTNPAKGDVVDRLAAYRRKLGDEWSAGLAQRGINPHKLPVSTDNTTGLLASLKERYSGAGPIEDLVDRMSSHLTPSGTNTIGRNGMVIPPSNKFQNVWNQRQNLDTLLYEKLINAPSGYKAELKTVGEQIRGAMNQDLVNAVPEFQDFLHRYSKAIQMEHGLKAGRELMGKTTNVARNLTTADDQLYGARSISGAKMDNLDLAAQEAKRGIRLTPNQTRAFEAAQEEKRRANILATGGAPGNSQTAQNLAVDQIIARDIASGVTGDGNKPGAVRSVLDSLIGSPLAMGTRLIGRGAQADIMQLIAKGLMSPEEGRRLMQMGEIAGVDPNAFRNSVGRGLAGQLYQYMTR